MKSIAFAPSKVILFGEHFVVYGARAILCAINKKVQVTTVPINENKIQIKSKMGQVSYNLNDPSTTAPLFRPFVFIAEKMIKQFSHVGGLEITIDSDVPSGVGLGSSSACCVAAAGSISRLFKIFPKEDILQLAIQAESTVFESVSGADNAICTYGKIIQYDKNVGYSKLDINWDIHFIIANSMQEHSTHNMVSKVAQFKKNNPDIFSSLYKKEEDLLSCVKDALYDKDITKLGKLMSENQEYLKRIGISNLTLENMINIANKTGFGSKITGAGGGGCIITIVDKQNIELTIKNLQKNNYECFLAKIDHTGLDFLV